MDKKQQLEFVRNELSETVKQYLSNESLYRTITVMAVTDARNDQLNSEQLKLSKAKKFLEAKIRSLRNFIEEIENGKFTV